MRASMWTLLLLGTPVVADAVLEINQACATASGCFSGDDPGFPITTQRNDGPQLSPYR